MLFLYCAILCGTAAISRAQTFRLLLPGFQGRDLEAHILSRDEQATTFLVTCPPTVAAADCSVSEAGMTAIAKDDSLELVDVNKKNSTASVSCQIAGTTYASCFATNTISVHATLAPKDLNWMNIAVRDASPNTEALVPSASTRPAMTTSLVKTPSGLETAGTSLAESQGTFMIETPWDLFKAIGSFVLGLLGYSCILFWL